MALRQPSRRFALLLLPAVILIAQAAPSTTGPGKSPAPITDTKPTPPTAPPEEINELPRRPNIIFIMADDMGVADLGVYGQKAYATPNVDRLAAEGMRFTRAYAGCTVCAPSRCVLMTGLHGGHTAVRANPGGVSLRATDVTITQMLKLAGYTCGGFGKWGLGDVGTDGVPEKHGFDTFFGYYNQVHAHFYFPPFLYRNSQRVALPGNDGFYGSDPQVRSAAGTGEKTANGAVPTLDPATGKKRQYSDYVIFDEMLKFIRTAAADKDHPFFCYAPWTLDHPMYQVPQ